MRHGFKMICGLVAVLGILSSVGGCLVLIDPPVWDQHIDRSVLFGGEGGFVAVHSVVWPLRESKLEVLGQLFSDETTCGERHKFTLRVKLACPNVLENIVLKPQHIQLFIKDSLVSNNGIDTLEYMGSDTNIVLDLFYAKEDTCLFMGMIEHPFDSLNPKVRIYFGEAIHIQGDIMPMDTIYAYK